MIPLVGLPETVALAAVAVLGYLVGRWRPQRSTAPSNDVRRAAVIAAHLESIAVALRRDLAIHRSQVDRFRNQIGEAKSAPSSESWRRVQEGAELVLEPTLRLVGQVSSAYEMLRNQSQALAALTGRRLDAVTGLANGQMLEEMLTAQISARCDNDESLALAALTIEPLDTAKAATEEQRREKAKEVARTIERQLRTGDFVASYGPDEYVVVMPGARLAGARRSAHRLLKMLSQRCAVRVSCGVTEYLPGDSPRCLLSRADSAAYSARAEGGGQFVHTGVSIRRDSPEAESEPGEPGRRMTTPQVDFPSTGFVTSKP